MVAYNFGSFKFLFCFRYNCYIYTFDFYFLYQFRFLVSNRSNIPCWLHLVFHVLRVVFPFSCQVFCHLVRRYPRLCVFAYEYFVFLWRVTNPSAKPPPLEDQFVSHSLASLLRPDRFGRPYQEQKVPAGIAH